jgi:hypothetical protein
LPRRTAACSHLCPPCSPQRRGAPAARTRSRRGPPRLRQIAAFNLP